MCWLNTHIRWLYSNKNIKKRERQVSFVLRLAVSSREIFQSQAEVLFVAI